MCRKASFIFGIFHTKCTCKGLSVVIAVMVGRMKPCSFLLMYVCVYYCIIIMIIDV